MPLLSARETAYQTIRSRIITMELKPGDPLNDRELAEELGISRTPMREALLMLNLARMVDIKPQSGTHVAPINLKLMEMEQFARYTLEKEILNRLRVCWSWIMHSTANPLSCVAWKLTTTTCWPACSMWSASASSAC